ncbi:MAG: type 4a pilus biogenesis protein PilO [Magnetococcales bacterium]|nr:type 4a pilus biogenesis protein PilO [Magnetococcales bacterium]
MELGFDPVDVLRLPLYKKIGIGFLILLVLLAGYWHFSLNDQLQLIESNRAKIAQQVESIAIKKRMLLRLPKLREELVILKEKEAKAARKLPSKKEIPALLTNISNAGHEQGLEFTLFAPKPEIVVDVYAQVPVEVRVRGPFHETLLFMNQVARFSRIVTFSNIEMKPQKDGQMLNTKAWVTTYRFLDIDQRPKKGKRKAGGKR